MNASLIRGWVSRGSVACWAVFAVWSYSAPYARTTLSAAAQVALRGGQQLGCNLSSNYTCKPDPACVKQNNVTVTNPGCASNLACAGLMNGTGCAVGIDGSTGDPLVAPGKVPMNFTNATMCVTQGLNPDGTPKSPNSVCAEPAGNIVLCVEYVTCKCFSSVDNDNQTTTICKNYGPSYDYVPPCFSNAN